MAPSFLGIAYDTEGHGDPVLLLHGYGMWREWWKACGYVDALAPTHRVIYIDLPGHGRSERPYDPEEYAMGRVVDSVLSLLDQLAVERLAVWGHGIGGTLAQALVLTGRVTRAVVGACTLAVPTEMYAVWATPLKDEARAGDWTGLKQRLGEPPVGLAPVEQAVELEAVAAYIDGNPWAATLDQLKASGVPLLCYHGDQDPAFPLAAYQAEQVGAEFLPVPGDLRDSFVNSEPVLAAAAAFLS